MNTTGTVRLRVTVTDAWDTVPIEASPDTTIRALKARALAEATGRRLDPASYIVKVRGALVLDEEQTVAELGLSHGAPLIVLPARRVPAW